MDQLPLHLNLILPSLKSAMFYLLIPTIYTSYDADCQVVDATEYVLPSAVVKSSLVKAVNPLLLFSLLTKLLRNLTPAQKPNLSDSLHLKTQPKSLCKTPIF